MIPCRGAENVNTHAHLKGELGLFTITGQDVWIITEFKDAEVNLHLAAIGGDRRSRPPVVMKPVHRGEVQRGEDIAVDHEDRFIGAIDHGQAAGGAQWRDLADVVNLRAEFAAVATEGLDEFSEITGDDRDITESEPRELTKHHLDDRHRVVVAQGHQRFREDVGERPKPCPFSPGEQDRLHTERSFLGCVDSSPDGKLGLLRALTRTPIGPLADLDRLVAATVSKRSISRAT